VPLPKRLTYFLLPGGLIAVAAAWVTFFVKLPAEIRTFWPYYPVLVLGAGLFLGTRFNRSRLIFAMLVLALADRALALYPTAPAVAAAVRFLLPLNLAAIAVYRERGLVTPLGLLRLGFITIQAPLIALALAFRPEALLHLLKLSFFPGLLPASLSQPILASLLLSAAVLVIVFWVRPEPFSGGLIWALPTALLPLLLGSSGPAPSLGLATAGLILVAAQLESSHGMAFRDDLTGLPARRALNEALLKLGRRYTVAMVDIDHFKKVNDRHGHDVGDQVLRMVAKNLAKTAGGGQPYRYGGEEFTLLFPGMDLDETLPYLERLRKTIESSQFTLRHPARPKRAPSEPAKKAGSQHLSVTVSIGVAEKGVERAQPEQVLKAADEALYQAKRSGRNRICEQPSRPNPKPQAA
jgi:diguanylate cyclase (GGDEF)-like protein